MIPGKLNLTIYQGATFRHVIRLTNPETPSTPLDLTGAVARMHIRATIDDDTTIIELDNTNGRAVVSDDENGEITLLIDAEDTALFDFTNAVYDLEIEYSNGTVDRALKGSVKLDKEVTR